MQRFARSVLLGRQYQTAQSWWPRRAANVTTSAIASTVTWCSSLVNTPIRCGDLSPQRRFRPGCRKRTCPMSARCLPMSPKQSGHSPRTKVLLSNADGDQKASSALLVKGLTGLESAPEGRTSVPEAHWLGVDNIACRTASARTTVIAALASMASRRRSYCSARLISAIRRARLWNALRIDLRHHDRGFHDQGKRQARIEGVLRHPDELLRQPVPQRGNQTAIAGRIAIFA